MVNSINIEDVDMITTSNNILHQTIAKFAQIKTKVDMALDFTLSSSFLMPESSIVSRLQDVLCDPVTYTYGVGGYERKFKQTFINFISDRYHVQLTEEMLLPTAGTKQALACTMFAMLSEGDSILLPQPGYPAYHNMAMNFGLHHINYDTTVNDELITRSIVDSIKIHSPKMVILNFPVNPTGKVLSKAQYIEIIKVARQNNTMIINDCILNDFDFSEPKFSIFELASYENILELYSFSKAHSLSGIRIGCIYGDSSLLKRVKTARQIYEFNVPVISLQAGVLALEIANETIEKNKSYIQSNLSQLLALFNKTNTEYISPDAGVSVIAKLPIKNVSSEEFCYRFYQDYGIKTLPGIIYGNDYHSYFRVTLMQTHEAFSIFCDRYIQFLNEYKVIHD